MTAHNRKFLQITIISTLLFAAILPMTSFGQGSGWTAPVQISPPESSGSFPDISVDAAGQIHIVWASTKSLFESSDDDEGGYNVVMYTTAPDGIAWGEATDIKAIPKQSGSDVTRPNILVDDAGKFHLTFRDNGIYYNRLPVGQVTNAAAWPSAQQLSLFDSAYFSQMLVDGQNNLHLVFTEKVIDESNAYCADCYHVFYRRFDNEAGKWLPATDISKLPVGAAKPQMVADNSDNLHVVWEFGAGGYGRLLEAGGLMYAASYDGGQTWTSPVELVSPESQGLNVAIGVDGKNQLLVVWLNTLEDKVYYQFSRDQGRSWSPPETIPGVWGGWSVYKTLQDHYTMATDSGGNIQLVLAGRTDVEQETLNLLHLQWDGVRWSTPETITTLSDNAPEWPQIAIGNGNQLHLTWFARDEENIADPENARYQIWYARRKTSSPEIASAPWPTATPAPTPPAKTATTQIAAATPRVVATLDPALKQVDLSSDTISSIYTETDDLLLLAKSLLPALLVVVAAVIAVRIWKR